MLFYRRSIADIYAELRRCPVTGPSGICTERVRESNNDQAFPFPRKALCRTVLTVWLKYTRPVIPATLLLS